MIYMEINRMSNKCEKFVVKLNLESCTQKHDIDLMNWPKVQIEPLWVNRTKKFYIDLEKEKKSPKKKGKNISNKNKRKNNFLNWAQRFKHSVCQ